MAVITHENTTYSFETVGAGVGKGVAVGDKV